MEREERPVSATATEETTGGESTQPAGLLWGGYPDSFPCMTQSLLILLVDACLSILYFQGRTSLPRGLPVILLKPLGDEGTARINCPWTILSLFVIGAFKRLQERRDFLSVQSEMLSTLKDAGNIKDQMDRRAETILHRAWKANGPHVRFSLYS